ncbi:MAG: hypothetical protein OMM_12377 [Candidatus Magnetoglobus multicellularis str. Araruama]|uniref:Uncharacterized protein n=1 Tax=Candidatus Magnetoglobus multicellularis str. Araruama TaxID=890399 RepID=A0A1V1NW26_9BACT|nr:MAG: hypothetical protein OMM_12377 [Candidatus Magnetoglobus multicellularis str. Araruama]
MIDEDNIIDNDNDEVLYPELIRKKGRFPTIEIDIGNIPKKFENNWTNTVVKITKEWVIDRKYTKKGTLWIWTAPSYNFQNNMTWSEFIMAQGLPKDFFNYLCTQLKHNFGKNIVKFSEYVEFSDEWMSICHVEKRKVWQEDDPYTYKQI